MRYSTAVAGLVVGVTVVVGLRLAAGHAPGVAAAQVPAAQRAVPPGQLPRLSADGRLARPEGWETWVLVGTSIGLSYNESSRTPGPGEPPGMFHNVYMQPWAYEYFMEHAAFAEETMFVLAMYRPSRNADPARGGFYQGEAAPVIEVHLKKAGVDSTGWGFYNFAGDAASAPKVPGQAACYSCHATKAGYDHVFTQFYPAIRARLGVEDRAP